VCERTCFQGWELTAHPLEWECSVQRGGEIPTNQIYHSVLFCVFQLFSIPVNSLI